MRQRLRICSIWTARRWERSARSLRLRMACWNGGWDSYPAGADSSLLPQGEKARALPLDVLLLRRGRGFAPRAGADNPNLIAVSETIRRRGDDAVVGGEAGGEFDFAAEVAGDGHRLEQHLVVRADGR